MATLSNGSLVGMRIALDSCDRLRVSTLIRSASPDNLSCWSACGTVTAVSLETVSKNGNHEVSSLSQLCHYSSSLDSISGGKTQSEIHACGRGKTSVLRLLATAMAARA
jgi:hypothetical protein